VSEATQANDTLHTRPVFALHAIGAHCMAWHGMTLLYGTSHHRPPKSVLSPSYPSDGRLGKTTTCNWVIPAYNLIVLSYRGPASTTSQCYLPTASPADVSPISTQEGHLVRLHITLIYSPLNSRVPFVSALPPSAETK